MTDSGPQAQKLWAFGIIWLGQFASLIGSEMSVFALTLWAWEQTESATSVSLLFFASQSSKVLAALFAGVLVDSCDRKHLMLLGNAIAGCSSIAVLVLFQTHHLAVWHLLITSGLNGFFSYLQDLALSASTPLLLPKKHFGRAGALNAVKGSGSFIFAPALAGAFYPWFGVLGILCLDLGTFSLAYLSLLFVQVPKPVLQGMPNWQNLFQTLTFGFRYICQQPSLKAILLFLFCNNFFRGGIFAIFPAMVLARTQNDAVFLATLQVTFGLGGLCGAVILSIIGGITPRINGLVLGVMLPQIGLITLAITQGKWVWIPVAFVTACFLPLVGTSNQAIWLAKVNPEIQGRVFASRFLLAQLSTPLGAVIAGPLADQVFEPAMQPEGALASLLGQWLGTGTGQGLALQLALFAVFAFLVGVIGYGLRPFREAEWRMPDYDQVY